MSPVKRLLFSHTLTSPFCDASVIEAHVAWFVFALVYDFVVVVVASKGRSVSHGLTEPVKENQ